MPRLVLPRCVVDTRVARGLRCSPPTTASTQFVHSCRWEIDKDGRCGERRDGTDAHRPKAAEIIQGGTHRVGTDCPSLTGHAQPQAESPASPSPPRWKLAPPRVLLR